MVEAEHGVGELELPDDEFGDLLLPRFASDASRLHRVGFDLSPLPADPVREAAVFLALFIGFLVLLHITRRLSGHSVAHPSPYNHPSGKV